MFRKIMERFCPVSNANCYTAITLGIGTDRPEKNSVDLGHMPQDAESGQDL